MLVQEDAIIPFILTAPDNNHDEHKNRAMQPFLKTYDSPSRQEIMKVIRLRNSVEGHRGPPRFRKQGTEAQSKRYDQ